jgi:hypothetical protein
MTRIEPPLGQRTRVPTEKQYDKLRCLGSGSAGLSWRKRDTEQLLQPGWVTADWQPPYYQWVRITADGLHALARAVERYGLPPLGPAKVTRPVCAGCAREWSPCCRHCGDRGYRYESTDAETIRR